MSRLTNEFVLSNIESGFHLDDEHIKFVKDKLEYADKMKYIEEQLGCPLEIVFKALKNGAYMAITKDDRDFRYFSSVEISNEYIYFFNSKYSSMCLSAKIKDYKKTWWLKEDRSE